MAPPSTSSSSRFARYRSAAAPSATEALCWNLYGAGLDNLGRNGEPERVPVPDTAADELLVRVDAVSLCYSDVKVLQQGSRHPKLQGRDLATRPTRLGHEVALTVIQVGGSLRERFQPGQRLALQPDIHHAGASTAYGYVIPGGLAQYQLLGPEVLSGDAGCYVLPLEADLAYAGIALSEPWACVEAAYTQRRRLRPKPGGRLWLVGRSGDNTAYEFSKGLDAPALVVTTDLSAPLLRRLREVCSCSSVRWVERNELAPEDYARLGAEMTDGEGFDDIVLLDPQSVERVSAAAALIASKGALNLVGHAALDGLVPVDVGRIHYDSVAYLGNPGPDIAASYGEERNRCGLRPGGCLVVVGAGGPMGQMHVQRALELSDGSATIIASELSGRRLAALAARFSSLATRHGKRLVCCDAAEDGSLKDVVDRETAGNGADDVVVCVSDAGAIAASARVMKPDGMLVVFAGVPRATLVPLDLSAVYLAGAQYTGTSGSTLSDQRAILDQAREGGLCLNRSVAAIGGVEAAREGLRAVSEGRFAGKVVLFPQVRGLPLTALGDLRQTLPDVADALDPGDVWSSAAEAVLVEKLWHP